MSEAAAQLLVFQVGMGVYAAQVRDAFEIGAVRDQPEEELVRETALGLPFTHLRGIVVQTGADEYRTLVVDAVLGVRAVEDEDLQPLPAFAAAVVRSQAVTGVVLLDEAPMPLVDLPELLRERPGDARPNPS
ncbi:MAG: chemotaxis protein CheW [Anaeromyxobacter sp.]